WRFVKISSSNFLTITILSLYEKVKSNETLKSTLPLIIMIFIYVIEI
ncbi:unnamed protein product, partial [Larinioides sclopetarius]